MPQAETVAKAQSRAQQFKSRRTAGGVPLTLPSGIEIIVRKVPMLDIMRHPELPHPIATIVNSLISEGARARSRKQDLQIDQAKVAEVFIGKILEDPMNNIEAVGNISLILCGVDPVFVGGDPNAASDEQVHVSEVELGDKVFVWSWLSGSDGDAESFRGESA